MLAEHVRIAYVAARRFHHLAAAFVASVLALLVALFAATSEWGAVALSSAVLGPAALFVAYRAWTFPRIELVDTILREPERLTMIFTLPLRGKQLMSLRLDTGQTVTLRFTSAATCEAVRAELAARAPAAADVRPPS